MNTSLQRLFRTLVLVAAVALTGCSAMQAQNPSSALKPVNAVPGEGDERLMLKGHDVVAYFTQGRHALGSAQFKSAHEGVTFHFASAEHKALFDAARPSTCRSTAGSAPTASSTASPGAATPTPG
jgi:YHS domain-containing protein